MCGDPDSIRPEPVVQPDALFLLPEGMCLIERIEEEWPSLCIAGDAKSTFRFSLRRNINWSSLRVSWHRYGNIVRKQELTYVRHRRTLESRR
jgi:hypothetical protein